MALLSNILGFSAFGLAARMGQLGIQNRNILDSAYPKPPFTNGARLLTKPHYCKIPDLGGHLIAMGVFGYAGYWAYRWDLRAGVLLAEKRAEIAARLRAEIAKAEERASAALGDSQ